MFELGNFDAKNEISDLIFQRVFREARMLQQQKSLRKYSKKKPRSNHDQIPMLLRLELHEFIVSAGRRSKKPVPKRPYLSLHQITIAKIGRSAE